MLVLHHVELSSGNDSVSEHTRKLDLLRNTIHLSLDHHSLELELPKPSVVKEACFAHPFGAKLFHKSRISIPVDDLILSSYIDCCSQHETSRS